MSLLAIPFDCLLPHLDDERFRRLWATCRQLKTDIEALGCFCRYSRCRCFLPKGEDVEGFCMKHYIGRRARIFYRGHSDLFGRFRYTDKAQQCKYMGKWYQQFYSLELESELDGIIKMLMAGGKYELTDGFYLTIMETFDYKYLKQRPSKIAYSIKVYDKTHTQHMCIIIGDGRHTLPCDFSPQMLMAIIVGRRAGLVHV